MTMPSSRLAACDASRDLDLIAQRILKLAEIATLEHLESLLASQAQGMLLLAQEASREAGTGSQGGSL